MPCRARESIWPAVTRKTVLALPLLLLLLLPSGGMAQWTAKSAGRGTAVLKAALPQATPTSADAVVEVPGGEPGPGHPDGPRPAGPPPNRRYSSADGSSGGLTLVEPGTGEVGSLRLQLTLGTSPADDFLGEEEQVGQSRASLSVSWTPLDVLEVFASLHERGTSLEAPVPATLQAQGALFGLKAFTDLAHPVRLGAGLRFGLRNDAGGRSPLLEATDIGLRGAASIDFRDVWRGVPCSRASMSTTCSTTARWPWRRGRAHVTRI